MAAVTVDDCLTPPQLRPAAVEAVAPAGQVGYDRPARVRRRRPAHRAFRGVDLADLGPFVHLKWSGQFAMNTHDELVTACADYEAGKLGVIPAKH